MPLGFLFWLLMVLWLALGMFANWPEDRSIGYRAYFPLGGNLLLFLLIFILGWRVFGFIIQG